MPNNLEQIPNLFIENKDFVRLANFLYKFLKNQLRKFSDKDIRSFTTLLAHYELEKYPGATEEGVIFRVGKYAEKINLEADYLQNIDDSLELWMNLLVIATSQEKSQEIIQNSELNPEQEDEFKEFEAVLTKTGLYMIERVIWQVRDPSLTNAIMSEVRQSISSDKNFNLIDFISKIETIKNDLLGIVKNINTIMQAKGVDKTNKKAAEHFIFEHRNFIKENCAKLFGNIFKPGQYLRNIRELYQKVTRTFEQRKRQRRSLKLENKKCKKQDKSKAERASIYSMLHSHSPVENLKIPEVLAGNNLLRMESKRLKSLGMSLAEGCDRAVVTSPDSNKFRSLVTRVAKKDNKITV